MSTTQRKVRSREDDNYSNWVIINYGVYKGLYHISCLLQIIKPFIRPPQGLLFLVLSCSDALSELAFSGRHRNHFLWVLTQKYNSVSKDIREQIKWLCLFFTKDRDSFEECLRENDVIPNKSERDRLKKCLQDRPYSKLILKCYQPTGYHLL